MDSTQGIPTGKALGTETLGVYLREFESIGQLIEQSDYLAKIDENGFDTCFILDNGPFEQAKAEVLSEKYNVLLKVFTDQPAMQFYTSEFLGEPFKSFQGVCLESQGYVDAPNHKHFPSVVVKPDSFYTNRISYQFEQG
ncbi:MAG: galactose mutarotase, partial [Gammaproteobacteria bacterium]|nr:galactose mutarotase [Gammaproteobacteria bacterium]